MKKATIYTGTGDGGSTSLIGGCRVQKNHPRVEAYGTLDELNAHLGLLCATIDDNGTTAFIESMESEILSLASYLATESPVPCPIANDNIQRLEQAIDALEAELPAMHSFILPAACETAARANVCRTICRRAERAMVTLQQSCHIEPHGMIFINRLSDYLFLLQRKLMQGKEKKWQKPCK